MRAQPVNFERGQDPKTALGIGLAQIIPTITSDDLEILSDLYDKLDESNQEIFLAQLEEDAEVLLAFAKTIAEE